MSERSQELFTHPALDPALAPESDTPALFPLEERSVFAGVALSFEAFDAVDASAFPTTTIARALADPLSLETVNAGE